ncbi:MAG TPA: GIY-YIG nuclease family protein [Caulobacteraceae bacterium]|nr:GIY-YIG nuclease family protein [Caulobacteraceae bacterium]
MVARDAAIAVYMMSNRMHGTLYIGVTSQLLRRVYQHREGLIEGFTKKYALKRLVWYREHRSMMAAIHDEKRLKKYKREWKVNLIERDNPDWSDLYPGLTGERRVSGWPEQVGP